MDSPLSQARALADPTRYSIFDVLGRAARAMPVAALVDHFGLNHNTVRQHLAKLVDAGLVVGSAPLHRPGRDVRHVGIRSRRPVASCGATRSRMSV